MRPEVGRMVPNFLHQALLGRPLTVYGEGTQSRSVQYVDDLIEGTFRLMKSAESRPVNVGNPHEMSVLEIAEMIIELSGSSSELVYEPLPEDDPKRRCPDITRRQGGPGLGATHPDARWSEEDPELVRRTGTQDLLRCASGRPEAADLSYL